MSAGKGFPSIWIDDFRSKAEFDSHSGRLGEAFSVFDRIDDHMLHSRHTIEHPAFCTACDKVTSMRIDWSFAGTASGSVHPAWTETCVCGECGLNSRMRALVDFLRKRIHATAGLRAYVAEKMTPSYPVLRRLFSSLEGSEYLSPEYRSGYLRITRQFKTIRHEDLTSLSFPDTNFDIVITQDVFEHIPEYRKAFSELYRVLKHGGRLVFTIPFFYSQDITTIRASVTEQGIVHHLPAEIHGNPVSKQGSLCFQNFGWDILADLRQSGFSDTFAAMYWGPWQGHLGFPFFVFCATKAS